MKNIFKRCASLLMLVLMVAALATITAPALAETVTTDTTTAAVEPTAVALDAGTQQLAIGTTLTLTPTLTPENAVTTYTWKTSDKKIATVSGGVVTPKKVGTVTITVTTANKKKAKVKVKVIDPYKPSSVTLDQTGTVKVAIGDKLTLNATLAPETAVSGLTWKSSKKKIASVSKTGVVTAKKVGTTTITVTTRNKKKAKVKIKVIDPYKPTSVALNLSGTQTLMAMNNLQLSATLYPETAKSTLKWKSSKKTVAIVDKNGMVTGIKPGTTTITVTTRNKKKAKIKIKVIDDGNQPITTTPDYNLPYVIYACKNSHTIAVVARDENGAWTRLIRKFPTSMGRKNVTNVGVFFLTKKERWHKWGSGYSPYANKLSIGLYLHGPIYKSKNLNTIRPSYYNVIGKDGSSGCLRTTCGCAAWIYYNCPVGTQVNIAQNSKFSEPRPAKLKKTAKKDPTDPGNNPEILVTSFSVEPAEVNTTQGATVALRPYNVTPSTNTTGGKFTYYSSNKDVATVSSSGVVTAVAPGSAMVVVTASDDFKAAVAVPVTVAAAAGEKTIAAEAVQIPADVAVESAAAVAEAPAAEEIIPGTEAAAVAEAPAPAEAPAEEPADAPAETADAPQAVSEDEPQSPTEDAEQLADETEAPEETLDEAVEQGGDAQPEEAPVVTEDGDFWFDAEDVAEDADDIEFDE